MTLASAMTQSHTCMIILFPVDGFRWMQDEIVTEYSVACSCNKASKSYVRFFMFLLLFFTSSRVGLSEQWRGFYLLRISRAFQRINGFVYIWFQKESKAGRGISQRRCANPGGGIHRFQQCTWLLENRGFPRGGSANPGGGGANPGGCQLPIFEKFSQ